MSLNAAGVVVNGFLSRSRSRLTFEISLTILSSRFESKQPKKTLMGKVTDWVKKKKKRIF